MSLRLSNIWFLVRWQKMALLVLRRVGLCVGQNQMCHLCGWLKLFLKNVRWGKIKIQKRRPLVRLSDGSFVPLLFDVLLCSSFYALSSFRLAGNVGSFAKLGYFMTVRPVADDNKGEEFYLNYKEASDTKRRSQNSAGD